MIAIVDYGVGNLFSLCCSLQSLGLDTAVTAEPEMIRRLAENGQIATQYVDLEGNATMDVRFNPNGSMEAIEGITSPDGRVLGKMGHSERIGSGLYRNVAGNYDIHLFESAVQYFKG